VSGPLVVVGDALLDRDLDGTVERLCPDAPVPVVDDPVGRTRPGGAALAAMLAALDGGEVVLVTALADDVAGEELLRLLGHVGVDVVRLALDGPTPEKVRVRAGGRPLLRLDHGARPTPPGPLTDAARRAITSAGAVLVSDYGRGLTARADLRDSLQSLGARVPLVWDPHPRGAQPTPGARLVTPNRSEAAALGEGAPATPEHRSGIAEVTAQAHALARRWRAASIAVTLGETGALLVGPDGPPMVVPARPVTGTDPCGAGDRFAAAATSSLLGGALTSEAVVHAVASASTFVGAGGAGGLRHGQPAGDRPSGATDPVELAARTHADGGTVVATGGCFDLLHAGHVGMLQAARSLGDCLVVCLNSDASVRRLKGPDRPLQRQDDRAAVLLALDCVDAVAVFDEPTPVPVLELLRPDVFAKGGDYAVADLPEATALAQWGGQAVVLPYLPGRSTTRLIDLATDRRPVTTGGLRAR
jgi:rfaE bifunctional protein nucleotidyltransferase chain/domain/rfaE bifunctional protein kinase chain/domain